MSKLRLQVNQYTQFGRRSRALFREIMLAVCEELVGEHEKHCPKCRHVVGFWQLSLGMLVDAYTLWLISPIQWHERCPKPRCEIARALRNTVATVITLEKSSLGVPGVEEWQPGGLWYFKVKLDDSFPWPRTPPRDKVIGWDEGTLRRRRNRLGRRSSEKIKCVEAGIPAGVRERVPSFIYWPQGIQLGGPPVV